MPWIETVPYDDATGKLKMLYDRVKGPDNNVDNIMMMHSLRPHSMEGHMAIYKYVLHHSGNTIPKWFLEVLGVWVSQLNGCNYCVQHHFSGMKRLLGDVPRADAILVAVNALDIEASPLDAAQHQAMRYAQKLTQDTANMAQTDVQALRDVQVDERALALADLDCYEAEVQEIFEPLRDVFEKGLLVEYAAEFGALKNIGS